MRGGDELILPLRGSTVLISPPLISRVVRELCPLLPFVIRSNSLRTNICLQNWIPLCCPSLRLKCHQFVILSPCGARMNRTRRPSRHDTMIVCNKLSVVGARARVRACARARVRVCVRVCGVCALLRFHSRSPNLFCFHFASVR